MTGAFAFATITDNNTVISWGKKSSGGESSPAVSSELQNVLEIIESNGNSFLRNHALVKRMLT